MPYESRWVDPPTDPTLPVLAEPPEGCVPGIGFGGPKEVRTPDHRRHFYECRHCKGWIEGHPHESRVNNLGPLSGRRGTEFHCVRCGHEVGFTGMMS